MGITRRQALLAMGAAAVGTSVTYKNNRTRTSNANGQNARTTNPGAEAAYPDRFAEFTFNGWNSIDRFTEVDTTEHIEIGTHDIDGDSASLDVTFREDGHYGTSLHYQFEESGHPEPEELHAQYYIRFDEDFQMETGGGKLPGPAGTYERAGWGGRRSDGTNGWSARMFFHPTGNQERPIQLANYLYHADMHGPYGEIRSWTESDAGKLETGMWNQIDNYVRLNTPGKNDGVVKGWVDGELALELDSLRFRDTPKLRIEEYWFDCYWGGSWHSPEDNHVYFDELSLFSSLRAPDGGTESTTN